MEAGRRRGMNNVNAAATVISFDDPHVLQDTPRKKDWWKRWSKYWCFGSHKRRRHIRQAALVPEPEEPEIPNFPTPRYLAQSSSITVAPPSSPASFFQSEPPSVSHSPVGIVAISPATTGIYSPNGPANIFAIGPYAHETQLVSPPVFSSFNTEYSTASFTPQESVQLTTPSSPEVPFARLLNPNFTNGEMEPRFQISNYEFQFYQLPPGSPIGQLISPSSGFSGSGTASPLPDGDITNFDPNFPSFRMGDVTISKRDGVSSSGQESLNCSGSVTPEARRLSTNPRNRFFMDLQIPQALMPPNLEVVECSNVELQAHHRISFDLNAEEVARCVENKFGTSLEDAVDDRCLAESIEFPVETSKAVSSSEEGKEEQQSGSIGLIDEFNFESDTHCPAMEEGEKASNNWTFLGMKQARVS